MIGTISEALARAGISGSTAEPMGSIDVDRIGDSLNRMVKLAIDSGEAESIDDAESLFAGYALHVEAREAELAHPAVQAAILTVVNAGRRTFLGGLTVDIGRDAPLARPIADSPTLAGAIRALGGRTARGAPAATPRILVGSPAPSRAGAGFAVRLHADGWSGGCVPAEDPLDATLTTPFAPAAALAAALAVAEAFLHVRRATPLAGRRRQGLSLWRPELDWLDQAAVGPEPALLPAALWVIGLGNLGQACLWLLGLLPYRDPRQLHLVLQDFDRIAPSNDSTSLLTGMAQVGQRKTRVMADWCERRGFSTAIIERRFQSDFRVAADEPSLALACVDNSPARRVLESVGFARVIEAGLGGGVADYLALRVHSFPATATAESLWPPGQRRSHDAPPQPAYQRLFADGADVCGLVRLARHHVGAPFVGTIAASLMIAEAVRMVNGAHNHAVVDAHLKALEHRVAVRQPADYLFNPGGTDCAGTGA